MKNLENKTRRNRAGFLPVLFGSVLSLLPFSKIQAQFNPNELPFETRGFVLPRDRDSPIDSLFVYNREKGLLAYTELMYYYANGADTGFNAFKLVIPSDLEDTSEIEGARPGDTLYFFGKDVATGNAHYPMYPVSGAVVHEPGQIKRIDFNASLVDVREDNPIVPVGFRLDQNYPNPFNSETNVRYSVQKRAKINLGIYNILGRHVKTLVDSEHGAGEYFLSFDGGDLSSGVYFLNMHADDDKVSSKKMIHLK